MRRFGLERLCWGQSRTPAPGSRLALFPAECSVQRDVRGITQEIVKFTMVLFRCRKDDLGMGDLGSNLRDARKRLGLTQEGVAERSGVHATEVSRIEAGKRDPRVSTLKRLAAAVEVPPGRLLD